MRAWEECIFIVETLFYRQVEQTATSPSNSFNVYSSKKISSAANIEPARSINLIFDVKRVSCQSHNEGDNKRMADDEILSKKSPVLTKRLRVVKDELLQTNGMFSKRTSLET